MPAPVLPESPVSPGSPESPESPIEAPPSAVPASRFRRTTKFAFLLLLLAWLSLVFWNSAKPLPPGTHIVSQTSRLSEAEVDFLSAMPRRQDSSAPDLAAIDHAEQLIVLDRSPV